MREQHRAAVLQLDEQRDEQRQRAEGEDEKQTAEHVERALDPRRAGKETAPDEARPADVEIQQRADECGRRCGVAARGVYAASTFGREEAERITIAIRMLKRPEGRAPGVAIHVQRADLLFAHTQTDVSIFTTVGRVAPLAPSGFAGSSARTE